MAEQTPFKVERETYYKATLPNGRKAELRNETMSVWTRGGEELAFGKSDILAMKAMYDELEKDRARK